MIRIKKILCPVDFFPASVAAVKYAAGLAENYGAAIHLLHVVAPVAVSQYDFQIDTTEILKSMETVSKHEMKKLVARVRSAGVDAEAEVQIGDVYDEITRAIEIMKPDLVVMGTHGRRGVERFFMGSTAEKLLRHSPVPMITISAAGKKASSPRPRFRRILVTIDFSGGTPDALDYAFSAAQENESQVTLLHVVHDFSAEVPGKFTNSVIDGVRKQLDDLVPAATRKRCDIVTRVEAGEPHQVILKMVEDLKIDLLVMNIHGKGVLDRALVGSTAERVVRAASCPVMLIPPMKRKLTKRAQPNRRAA
jgi:nucleotide-binding universal stress UspA family protein